MRALITGASGFVGEHLSKRLSKMGWELCLLPREQLESGKKINFEADYIFHLAAYGQMIHQRDDVDEIYNTNVNKLLKLLKATNHIKYKGFINIGTSSEYGKKARLMKEKDLLEPDFFYASSKAAGTLLCLAWAKTFNKPIVTVRPFSIYGPGEAEFRFIPTIIRSGIESREIKLTEGVHDWIYIQDFIDALLIAAKNIKKIRGGIVNVGTGKQYTNKQVLKLLSNNIKPLRYTESKMRPNDTKVCWRADNSLLRSLGWKQKYTLAQGLEATVSYYSPE